MKYGTTLVTNLEVPEENFEGNEIQGLRSTGGGRGSRAQIARQSRNQLISTDNLFAEMWSAGLNVSVRQ